MPSISTKHAPAVKKVICTHCEQPSEVARRAMSIFCPHCKKRLILEDFKITSYYAVREFFTCGDILVERKGHVVAPIKVGHLTVKGKVQGRVMARASVRICKKASFQGELETPVLLVESGAMLNAIVRIGATTVDRS